MTGFVDVPLFPGYAPDPASDPYDGLGVDARRTRKQAQLLASGIHPNTRARLHPQAAPVGDRTADGLRCRTCAHHETFTHHNRTYPKCLHPAGRGDTSSAASDCRGWWPACVHHEAAS